MEIDHNVHGTTFERSSEWPQIVEFLENNDFAERCIVKISDYDEKVTFTWTEKSDGTKKIIEVRAWFKPGYQFKDVV